MMAVTPAAERPIRSEIDRAARPAAFEPGAHPGREQGRSTEPLRGDEHVAPAAAPVYRTRTWWIAGMGMCSGIIGFELMAVVPLLGLRSADGIAALARDGLWADGLAIVAALLMMGVLVAVRSASSVPVGRRR